MALVKRLKKTTSRQYEEILNFVAENKIVLSGKMKPSENKKIDTLWKEFTENINSKGYGPSKSVDQWRHVFKEWKANTKRKSRQIQLSMNGTGGGPPTNKSLTDLELKLLSLISKIHLGDTLISDSLISLEHDYVIPDVELGECSTNEIFSPLPECEEGTEFRQEEEFILSQDLGVEQDVSNVDDSLSTKHESTTVKEKNKSWGKRKVGLIKNNESRYTSSILKDATTNYLNAQKLNLQCENKKAEGIHKLSESVISYIEVLKARNDIEKLKVENVRKQNKMEYYKIFGTTTGYEEF